MGTLSKDNKINEVIPNQEKSRYDCSKYKPLLDVDFNISNQCCSVMKKSVVHKYKKYAITAQTAEESRLRTQQWLKNGCNGFNMKRPVSNPMSFWKEQDVLEYIKRFNLPIASVYGSVVESGVDDGQMTLADFGCNCGNCELKTSGVARTGCVFCGYGVHLEKEPTRFQRLKETHPRLYEYCMGGGEYIDGVWQPNKKGLGMKHIFDECNKIYGDGFIKYE